MKKLSVLLALVLALLLLCGCWDKKELEDNTFAVLLGIDTADDNNVVVTVAFPLTQAKSGGGDESEDSDSGNYAIMSVKAPTVVEGLNMFTTKLSGPLALYSIKTIVLSQELAQNDMLRKVFASWRYEEIRSTTNVLISSCTAAEFIEARISNSPIDAMRQEELLLEQASGGAYYKPIQLLELLSNLKSNRGDGIAMYGGVSAGGDDEKESAEIKEPVKEGYLPDELPIKAENMSVVSGIAVFSGERMVGALNSAEAQTFSLLTNSKASVILSFADPFESDCCVVVKIIPQRIKIRSSADGDVPVFKIDTVLKCTVESIQSHVDYEQPQNYNALTEHVKKICEDSMNELIEKIQKKFDADILRLGDKLACHFTTVQEWESFNWQEKYKEAEINLNVKLNIERTGIMLP